VKNVNDEKLAVIIIWLPCIETDSRSAAEEQSKKTADPRIQYFWDGGRVTGYLWQETLDLASFAWDVYLLFDRTVSWTDPSPKPTFWMQQLPAAKDKAPPLDLATLTAKVKELLKIQ
jgi:hypothetical protein